MTKLELAENKFYNRKDSKPPYYKDFNEFILDCYLDYPPASYGKYIQHKIFMDLSVNSGIAVREISDRDNRGDCELVYPLYGSEEKIVKENKTYFYRVQPDEKYVKKYNFEIKVSYLGKNDNYGLRNLKVYQELKGGYIICLIDCEINFTPEFYVVNSSVITSEFTLTFMNGHSSQHKENAFENYGASFKKDSSGHEALRYNNLMDGTSFDDLVSFMTEKLSDMEIEFNNNSEYKKYIQRILSKEWDKQYLKTNF